MHTPSPIEHAGVGPVERAALYTAADAVNRPLLCPLCPLCPLRSFRERQVLGAIDRATDQADARTVAVCGVIGILPADMLSGPDLGALLGALRDLVSRSHSLRTAAGNADLDLDYAILALDERTAVAEEVAHG